MLSLTFHLASRLDGIKQPRYALFSIFELNAARNGGKRFLRCAFICALDLTSNAGREVGQRLALVRSDCALALIRVIWVRTERKYFLKEDWTGRHSLNCFSKSSCAHKCLSALPVCPDQQTFSESIPGDKSLAAILRYAM